MEAVRNGNLAKTLNTLRTVPGAKNPFVFRSNPVVRSMSREDSPMEVAVPLSHAERRDFAIGMFFDHLNSILVMVKPLIKKAVDDELNRKK